MNEMTAATIHDRQKKYAKLLDTANLGTDLMRRSVRGGTATMLGQGVQFLLQICSTMVLARLLTPSDFGLVAMVAPVAAFLGMFQDLGLAMATVQRKEITHAQVSGLFWINVFASIILTLLCICLAPVVAAFYNDSRLKAVTAAMGALFILGGLTSQHTAILRRQMRFFRLAILQVLSFALGALSAIIAAAMGFGYWALVFMPAANGLTNLVGAWSSTQWRPGSLRRGVGLRSLVKFAGALTGFNFANFFARNLDNVLIGRVWGEYSLGLYSRAYSFLLMPLGQINEPIASVATPALSHLQHEPERFRKYYCAVLRSSTFFTFPLIAFLILNSRHIVLLLFGKQWEAMIPIFQILSISAFAQVIGNMTGVLYTSLGLGQRMFKWGLMSGTWLSLSFFVGLPYGAIGVAVAYTSAMILMIIPLVLYAIYPTPVQARDVWGSIQQNLACTACAWAVAFSIGLLITQLNYIYILLASLSIFGIVYLGVHIIMIGSWSKMQDLWKAGRSQIMY